MATFLQEVNLDGWAGGNFYLKLTYDLLSQSVENNKSTVRYYEYVGSRNGWSGWGADASGYINDAWVGSTTSIGTNSEVYLGYKDIEYTHNTDGTKTANYKAGFYTSWDGVGGATFEGTFTLPTIPRYFSSDPVFTLSKNNETSFSVSWTTPENCSKVRYSLNNGASWTTAQSSINTTSGTFTISGLTAGTLYNIVGEFTRKDSSLTSNVTSQQTTYSYPYISAITPTAGSVWNMSGSSQNVSATIYNPLSRSIKAYISVNTTSGTKVVTFTTGTGTSFSSSMTKSTVNNAITTAQSATLIYWCEYSTDGTNYTTSGTTVTNTYQLREADCKPTISNFTYDDGNSTTKSVIGNSGQTLVQNYSILKAKVGTATYQYGATFKSMTITLGSKTVAATINTAAELGKFNYSSAQTMSATITDSRGWTHTITKSVTFVGYSPPQVSVSAQRTGGYGTAATFTVNASYTNITIGETQKNAWSNSSTAYVRYAISPAPSTPAATGNVSNANPVNDVVTNITGADNDTTYTITIYANDKITSATATATFGKGQPILGVFKDNQTVGVNRIPETTDASGLYVTGVTNLNGATTITGATGITGNTTITGNLSNVTGTAKITGATTTAAITASGKITANNTTASTSTTTGSIICKGGVGIAKNSYFGGNINVTSNATIGGTLTVNSKTLLDWTHPVGSIYISTVSTSPATLFGGTWTQIKDTFLLTAGDTYTAGDTGGEATHLLTIDEMPSHNHNNLKPRWNTNPGANAVYGSTGEGSGAQYDYLFYSGGDQPHNNMPPYQVVYAWERTA